MRAAPNKSLQRTRLRAPLSSDPLGAAAKVWAGLGGAPVELRLRSKTSPPRVRRPASPARPLTVSRSCNAFESAKERGLRSRRGQQVAKP